MITTQFTKRDRNVDKIGVSHCMECQCGEDVLKKKHAHITL